MKKDEYLLKRPFDWLLATVGILFLAPVWILISLAIKLQDCGPILYTQDRWGRGGKKFITYKFRTMVPKADEKWGPLQAVAGDARFTPLGRLLRGTALDELPQLVNIWRGEMSFVGPRAHAVNEIPRSQESLPDPFQGSKEFWERLAVRPGLTGLAQIYASRDVSLKKKFRYDRLYIRNQNLRLDLKLIGCSVWISLRSKWETDGSKL